LLAGGIKSAFDLITPNIQGISAKGATVCWGFFAPSKLGLKQITELTRAGRVSFDNNNFITLIQTILS
jgi:hypothetical protein